MSEWCSIEDVYEAYLDCKKRKSKSTSYARFAANEAANIYDLWKDLNDHTYEIGKSDAFCVTRPKVREVFAAQFRDRIVHHLVMLRLLPHFERVFIQDTYNCRKGKGTDYGIDRVALFMEEHPDGWILKCDLRCFFMNIDKAYLAANLERFIRANYIAPDTDEIVALVRKIVLHRPETRCIRKGDLNLWNELQKGKSLFDRDGNHGLAIGNLTSQIFANFYLLPLDEWLSKKEGVCYGRYVDDFVLVSDDKRLLLSLLPEIRAFLQRELSLTLHPDKIYLQPVRHGVKFLGSVIKNGRKYAGNRTVSNTIDLVREYDFVKDKEQYIEKFMQRYNSYMGYLKHRKTYGIRWRVWKMARSVVGKYAYMINNLCVLKIKNEYKQITNYKKLYSHGKRYHAERRISKGCACIYAQR